MKIFLISPYGVGIRERKLSCLSEFLVWSRWFRVKQFAGGGMILSNQRILNLPVSLKVPRCQPPIQSRSY